MCGPMLLESLYLLVSTFDLITSEKYGQNCIVCTNRTIYEYEYQSIFKSLGTSKCPKTGARLAL